MSENMEYRERCMTSIGLLLTVGKLQKHWIFVYLRKEGGTINYYVFLDIIIKLEMYKKGKKVKSISIDSLKNNPDWDQNIKKKNMFFYPKYLG